MAWTKYGHTKDGRAFYRIFVSRGRGKAPFSKRWYIPEGWSKKTIEKELNKVACRFEEQCKAGEIQTRQEQKEAEMLEAEIRRIEAEKIKTVKEYGEQVFIPTKAIECKPSTCAFYQFMLDGHIYPAIGNKNLGDVVPNDITRIILNLRASSLSYSTIKGVYITVSQLFNMAYLEDIIPSNPCAKVKRPQRTSKDGRDNEVKAFSLEELAYIMKCLEKEPIKWRCLVRLLIDTGIRRGEACGLKWNCINLKDGSIRIENNLCYTPEAGVIDQKPKNGKSRTIYISQAMASLLKEYRASLTRLSLRGYVFTQEDGYSPMHPQTPTKYLKKFGKRYEIADCHPHKLRHSFATIAITNGADIASISELLGHSNTSVTLDVYTHASEAAQRKASDIFHQAMALEECQNKA